MNVQNIKELEVWLNKLLTNNFKFLRFLEYPAGYLHMNWKDELIKHGRLYEKDHRHFTFHHIRLLLKALKKNKIKHPLVGIAHESQIQINPGGSRLMVAKKLRIPTVPLDYICRADNVHLARNTQYKEIKDVDTFLEPFNDIEDDVQIDLHEGENFWYELVFNKEFHWCENDIDNWIENKQNITCVNPLDYYFI